MKLKFCIDTPEQCALLNCGKMNEGDVWNNASLIFGDGRGAGSSYYDYINDGGVGLSREVWI